MDLMKIGTDLLMSKLGGVENAESVSGALGQLLGGETTAIWILVDWYKK